MGARVSDRRSCRTLEVRRGTAQGQGWRRGGGAGLAAWWRGRAGGVVERQGGRRGREAGRAAWWRGSVSGVAERQACEGVGIRGTRVGSRVGCASGERSASQGRIADRAQGVPPPPLRPCSEGVDAWRMAEGVCLADRDDRLGGWPGRQAWRMAGQTGLADGRADRAHRDTRRRIKSRSRPGVRETPPASAHRVPEGDATASFP